MQKPVQIDLEKKKSRVERKITLCCEFQLSLKNCALNNQNQAPENYEQEKQAPENYDISRMAENLMEKNQEKYSVVGTLGKRKREIKGLTEKNHRKHRSKKKTLENILSTAKSTVLKRKECANGNKSKRQKISLNHCSPWKQNGYGLRRQLLSMKLVKSQQFKSPLNYRSFINLKSLPIIDPK